MRPDLRILTDQAQSKLQKSMPPANLADLPDDIKEVEVALVDPEWFPLPKPLLRPQRRAGSQMATPECPYAGRIRG